MNRGFLYAFIVCTLSSLNSNVSEFAIAPNNQYIAYLADQDTNGTSELYIGDFSGGNAVKINDTLPSYGIVSAFHWSHDSLQIAYVDSLRKLNSNSAVGGKELALNHPDVSNLTAVRWIADSTSVAYLADNELYVSSDDGLALRKLNSDRAELITLIKLRRSFSDRSVASC